MKTIAIVLLAVAIAVLVIKGFSWTWLTVAVFGVATLAWKGLRAALENTFESG